MSSLHHALTDDDHWYDAITDLEAAPTMNLFDKFGNYRHRVIVQCAEEQPPDDVTVDDQPSDDDDIVAPSTPRHTTSKERDWNLLRPLFGWLSADIIKDTFSKTT
jgi:hypothetical protein